MANVLFTDDFESGIFKIPLATKQEARLNEYINFTECEYLPKLFGVELSELFLADLDVDGNPTSARFIDIFIKFSIQPEDDCGDCQIYTSLGMRELLKGILYWHYVRGSWSKLTNNGAKITASENSDNIRQNEHEIYSWYSRSVQYWCAMQYKMKIELPLIYPEFKGCGIQKPINF